MLQYSLLLAHLARETATW